MAVTGGDKLQKVLAKIAADIKGNGLVKVGFQDGMTYPTKEGQQAVYVAQVAFWNEYGTTSSKGHAGIPPRPFFRSMIAAKSPKWGDNLGRVLVANGYDKNKALSLVGGKIVEQLQDSIKNGGWQENTDSTVARKGFDKPLIDSGVMWRDAITSVVEDGE